MNPFPPPPPPNKSDEFDCVVTAVDVDDVAAATAANVDAVTEEGARMELAAEETAATETELSGNVDKGSGYFFYMAWREKRTPYTNELR